MRYSNVVKPQNPYLIFYTEMCGKLRTQNPELRMSDIARLAGAAWKTLSKQDKAKYTELGKADKSRFEREYAEETEQNGGVKLPIKLSRSSRAKVPFYRTGPSSSKRRPSTER